MHDLVIKGGQLFDGSGAPSRLADVAIDGGIISAVGEVGRGRRELDARGRIVTPGFVDVHTHYDAQATWDPYLTPSSWHGCTTVVMGNCGVGFAPVKPERREWLIGLMEGVEDIPGAALSEGIKWQWETFPEFLDALGREHRAIDFGCQIPHGALRAYVMGERGAANEAATANDVAAMYRLVREALEAGALGFSTSRTELHKSIWGEPVPGTYAAKDELFGIGKALHDTGRGVFQLAVEHLRVPEESAWMAELAEHYGRPVVFSLTQTDFAPELWRGLVETLDSASARGIPLYGQVAGRAIGIIMGWELSAHPFALHPTFEALKAEHSDHEELLAALRRPEIRAKILAESPRKVGPFEQFVTQSFHKMFPVGAELDYEPEPSTCVRTVAKERGLHPAEVAYDALNAEKGQGLIYFPLFNYAKGDLEHLRTLHNHPRTLMGLSDAGAHCGAVCDGGMPSFMLTHWTRDRRRGDTLPLAHIIKRQTSDTASFYGLSDRGLIAPGYKADVNVIDYDGLHLERPRCVRDLPAGGRRLIQRAKGYVATVCSGKVIVQDDEVTGELPGRLLRGAQRAPSQGLSGQAA